MHTHTFIHLLGGFRAFSLASEKSCMAQGLLVTWPWISQG